MEESITQEDCKQIELLDVFSVSSSVGFSILLDSSFSSVQFSSVAQSGLTPCDPVTTAHQASLSITNSRSPPKPMSIVSAMPSNHLILCRPLLLLPPIFPSIRVFSVAYPLLILETDLEGQKQSSIKHSLSPGYLEHESLLGAQAQSAISPCFCFFSSLTEPNSKQQTLSPYRIHALHRACGTQRADICP